MSIFKRLNNNRGVLLKNTMLLYVLQFSTYFLALLATPYETRVLGAEVFGLLETSLAIITYFQLIIDFGFLLSATEEVSRERHNQQRLCQILTAVTCGKLLLIALSYGLLLFLCHMIPSWEHKQSIIILCFVASVLNSLLPDFLYRGLEKMTAITVRTVLIRIFFTGAIFVFLKSPEQVWVVPLLNMVGNAIALVLTYLHVSRYMKINFVRIPAKEVFRELKRSYMFFFSRIATTAYTVMNTVILDIISNGGAVTGYYTSANKLINAGKNGLSPIADSMYPYMAQHKDFKLVKKVLLIFEPLILLFCTVVFVFAEPFCVLFFGEEFGPTGDVLRAMLPIGVVTLPNYILGFPTMTAMGISKHANYSTIFGSVFHILLLLILFLTDSLSIISLAVSVSVTETVILIYRITAIYVNRNRFNAGA